MQGKFPQLLLPWDHSVLGFLIALVAAPVFSLLLITGFQARTVTQGSNLSKAITFNRASKPFGYWLCLIFYAVVMLESIVRVCVQIAYWAS